MSKRVSCESKKPILVQESDLTSILGNSSEGSLTTSSNVETLERGLRLTSALSRYEKDQSQQPQSQGQGQAVRTVLQRHISSLLSEVELIPSHSSERASVIARTPSRQIPRTSTPSNSPSAPPIPPRNCQSLGPEVPRTRSCSPVCSEISSINEDVFFDNQSIEPAESSRSVVKQVRSPLSLSQSAPGGPISIPLITITGTMEDAERIINKKTRNFNRFIRVRHVGAITEESVIYYRDDIKEVEDLMVDIVDGIEDLVSEFRNTMTQNQLENWTELIPKVETTYSNYKIQIENKVAEIRKNVGASSNQDQINLLRRQTEAQEKILENAAAEKVEKLNETSRVVEKEKTAAIATATVKYDTIVANSGKLASKVNKVVDWELESDLEVGRAMRKIKNWKVEMEKIETLNRDLKELVLSNGISDNDISLMAAEALANSVSEELTETVEAIEQQDDVRKLFTLDTAKSDLVKLPIFEGKDSEDFSIFKEKIGKAFDQNRTSKSDQLDKLRECLRGHAKKIVPDSMTKTIEEAWADLEKAFGDADRVMTHRKEALVKLGKLPKFNAKGGYKAQVEWYLQLEALIRGIMELGRKDHEMSLEAWSSQTVKSVFNLFPNLLVNELVECPGYGEDQLGAIFEKITKFRVKAQKMQKYSDSTSSTSGDTGGGGNGGHGGGKSKAITASNVSHDLLMSHQMYKPPRRDDNCRICTMLETGGDTKDLYDHHLSNFPTGCPRYMKMKVEERLKVATKARICLKCHDPEYIYKKDDEKHKCLITKQKKSRYTCADKTGKCLFHMWICCYHKEDNKEKLKQFKEEISKKFSLEFAYVVNQPVDKFFDSENSEPEEPLTEFVISLVKKKHSEAVNVEPETSAKNINVPDVMSQVKDLSIDIVNSVNPSQSNYKNLSTAQATKKLQRKLSTRGENVELRPIPKGRAQFMIGHIKGKSRPLLKLYDTGCGGLLFREGVPEKELDPAVMKTKGPYVVKGVGDTSVRVNDEWMCSLRLRDGSRQSVEGWTVDKITATMPFVNMTQAEAELKAGNEENEKIKSLKVEPVIGGDVDILMGIMYSAIFPIAVHSLPSGLTIYELQVTPHDKTFNSVIGGPHESFQFLAGQAGSWNIAFVQLLQQLETYKEFGPPKLNNSIMTLEDLEFAEKFKEWEIENITKKSLETVDLMAIEDRSQEDVQVDEINDSIDQESQEAVTEEHAEKLPVLVELDSDDDSDDEIHHVRKPKKKLKRKHIKNPDLIGNYNDAKVGDQFFDIACSKCGESLSDRNSSLSEVLMDWAGAFPVKVDDDDENLKALRKLHQAQQEGFQIEYRCPRCRNCSDCRRSFQTERVSLREEAEDLMIWDSVVLDWDKKRIICYLPLRGSEEEFLSTNRDIALRILDQQCFKYFKDDETRELIVKAFKKLFKNNQVVLWKDLPEEQKKTVEAKAVQHYIPWRVSFKPSLSTPARPVLDASTNTKPRPDGSAGRCLNDLVVKGRVVTLNLVKMVQRFCVGRAAVQGDLKQFYASIKLVEDQWNLQRILYRENLDPQADVLEAVIKTLIWGVKSVSAQSECAVIKLAQFVQEDNPELADFLVNCRFVDDLGCSAKDVPTLKKLTDAADELFEKVDLACKGFTYSGSDPIPELTDDGKTLSIGGLKWHSKLDLLEIPFPALHFSKKLRGRLVVGTKVFEGSCLDDMNKFVPAKLTRRMIFSKNGAIFDLPGKFAPILASFKLNLREAVKLTKGWDDAVPEELRSSWVKNFWRLETLRGIKFQRARMPENAVSTEMDMIVAVDAAEQMKVIGAWGRFRLDSGDFSCQLLIGRSLLADEDSSIPKQELESLTMGSNLGWILRQSLESWISSYILIGDSTIALCWVTSEKKRLSLFHRNRCVQVRRGTDLNLMYHVISEQNPADLGTRPSLVQDSDVGPNSRWEKGMTWMRGEIDDAIEAGILTPAETLRMNDEEEEMYKKGLVFEKSPEILTRGHPIVLSNTRVEKVKERSQFSEYPLSPTKYKFENVVRIYAIVRKWIRSFRCIEGKLQVREDVTKFQMFQVTFIEDIQQRMVECAPTLVEELTNIDSQVNQSFGARKSGMVFKGKIYIDLSCEEISWALEFLFKKATEEVKKFNKADFIAKIAVEKNGILYCKSRILDCQRFEVAGDLETFDILSEFGIKLMTPVLDRHSPLSYSIGDYIHRLLAKHGGYEKCLRESLNHCYIIQGMSLFRELGDDCMRCAKKRKKYLEASMGPIPDEKLTVAPAFWVTMVDIYGPCHIYVPGHAMKTRHRKVVEAKCYVLVFCCPTTKLVNLQVIESKSHDGVIDGVTRLSCEIGVPSFILVDQDSGIVKALKEAEVNIRDLQFVLNKEKGIRFKTCPVGGHNFHGLVERKIRTVQECLDKCDVASLRLHATGLQTLCKLVENDINNLPLGYSYGRDSDTSPLLKLVSPNMLRPGRINSRALSGPIRLPKGPGELMKKVEKAYDAFFKLWNVTMIPKLMKLNKWFNSDAQLQVGDIVWFQKEESELSSVWTVGRITEVVKSKDEIVRRAVVRYSNASENEPRFTDRAARKLIKLFNVDDENWQHEMAEVERLVFDLKREKSSDANSSYSMNHTGEGLKFRLVANSGYDYPQREVGVQHRPAAKVARSKLLSPCKMCCCASHCRLTEHETVDVAIDFEQEYSYANMLDRSWVDTEYYDEVLADMYANENDNFMALLCSVNTDLDGEDDEIRCSTSH